MLSPRRSAQLGLAAAVTVMVTSMTILAQAGHPGAKPAQDAQDAQAAISTANGPANASMALAVQGPR